MKGLVSMIAASAVLSAGLVAGLAATDAAARPEPTVAPAPNAPPVAAPVSPASPAETGTSAHETPKTAPACTAAAWPYLPAGCAGEGRKVRIIALTGR